MGKLDLAIDHLAEAVRLDPENSAALIAMGDAKERSGRTEDASLDNNEAICRAPGNADYHNNRGVCFGRTNEHEKALADFDEAIRLNPELVAAYINRGNVKVKKEITWAL